jgi:Pyruvate/2-oxoacid:ferredoxin oxidoreductase gamma subunit
MAEKLSTGRTRGLVPATYVEEIPGSGGQGVAGARENNASAAIAMGTSGAVGKHVDPAKVSF